ncbi:hypothetical protein IFO70_30480, partial [Phormidium tenue FACHB-886]|nr:hypothetical protein [Phormidium tenue FACHB-886]
YTGQGGLSPSPQEADVGDLWQDWRLPTAGSDRPAQHPFQTQSSIPSEHISSRSSPSTSLVEAQGWKLNPQGQIQLIAQAPTVIPYSSWQTPTHCGAHQ